jgi:hypothetical protein
MAKKNSKRREWTKTDIRELKTLARGKTPAGKIARALKRTEGATEFPWILVADCKRLAEEVVPVV